jgi:hypothetical protein
MTVDNIIFRRLTSAPSLVGVEVVLQDLLLLDNEVKELYPREQRLSFLAAALRKRNFFRSAQQALDMADLFLRLREMYALNDLESLDALVREFQLYKVERNGTGT